MKTQDAKKIRMEDLLATLGFLPAKTTHQGGKIWYQSPLRADKDPSFKIEVKYNSWYDFGLGRGGNILDFIMIHQNTNLSDSLSFLDNLNITSFHNTKVATILGSGVEIKKIQDLQNKALIEYLESRKLNIDIAKTYLKEIYYRANKKKWFGVAFRNNKGGWEVRSKYFKGGLMTKGITTIKKADKSNEITVFEGFIDYLTILTEQKKKELKTDVIILNSVALIDEAIHFINEGGYTKVYTLLDNDDGGKTAFEKIKTACQGVTDYSYLYKGYNDPNEKLMDEKKD